MSSLPYIVYFVALCVACAVLYQRTASGGNAALARAAASPEFRAFQTLFLGVYLTMTTADWMQVRAALGGAKRKAPL